MVRIRRELVWLVALAAALAAAAPVFGAPRADRAQTLFFDAVFTQLRAAGPGAGHVGHRQIATGILRSATGRRIGTFAFTCTWTRIDPGGTAERCSGSARTPDGRLEAAGPARSNDVVHSWRVIGGSGAYRGAAGTVIVRDLGDRESLISAVLTTHEHTALQAGKVSRPAANDTFTARANGLCASAAGRLAALPAFPFQAFDALHPDPSLLPAVGAFFTGPGDPRPALRALDAGLRRLGAPPAARRGWRAVVRARDRELTVIGEQDRAALAGDVRSFVASVHHSVRNFRDIAITATVFGVTRCVL